MYTKQIAVVTAAMSDLQQSSRTRDLCQLFVFAERFYLPHKFSNQILDAIQDAFFLTGKLPDYGLITGIYKYTGGSSKLRSFVAHCLVFGIRSESFSCYDNVGLLLQQNGDLMADFSKLFTLMKTAASLNRSIYIGRLLTVTSQYLLLRSSSLTMILVSETAVVTRVAWSVLTVGFHCLDIGPVPSTSVSWRGTIFQPE